MLPRSSLLILTGCALVASCANESGATMGLGSATAPVIAMLHDDLFVGQATGYIDRTGTIDVKSVAHPGIRCVGSFRYTGKRIGAAKLQCNDGAEAAFDFNGLSALSGYGIGKSTRGVASFTYGLTPEQAQQYLVLPPRTKLEKRPEGVRLMDT